MTIHHLHIADKNRLRSFLYIAVGMVITIAILVEGAHENKDRRQVQAGIEKIAKAVSESNVTPDQVLAAAASKILEQGKEIEVLRDHVQKLSNAPRDQGSLYQGGKVVARVVGPSFDENTVRFVQIVDAATLNTHAEFEFDKLVLKIADYTGSTGVSGVSDRYINVICSIIGKRD